MKYRQVPKSAHTERRRSYHQQMAADMCAFFIGLAMSTAKQIFNAHNRLTTHENPVVIVGTGPVGMRAAQEILKRDPTSIIYMYGGEPWAPYDRVALSSVLSGETDWSSIDSNIHIPNEARLIRFDNCPITHINRREKLIIDCESREQSYSELILATGSSPHVPAIQGIHLPGVYTFRNRTDIQSLMARRTRSRHTVVLGGGLLGLEAAKAMQQQNTEVTLIEHGSRLMGNQLDDAAATILREHLLKLGINISLGNGVKQIIGENTVNGLQLQNGRIIHCDTVILATGIRPNIELARECGLSIGTGIRVNDYMQTSDPSIYAIGECSEHNGKVYGLVAPGLEQSAVAAHTITGGMSRYTGSTQSSLLKVVGIPVFSSGNPDTEQERPALLKNFIYEKHSEHVYRKLVVENGRLVGAIGVGAWHDIQRVLEAIRNKHRIWPWQIMRFLRTGSIWPDGNNDNVAAWPSSTVVCNCKNVCRGELSDNIEAGCSTVEALMNKTGASTVCGSCKPLIANLVGDTLIEHPGLLTRPLFMASLVSIIISFILLVSPAVPYTTSTSLRFSYDLLWRDGLARQITGFTLMGLSLLLLLLPLRKRWSKFKLGSFVNWRVVHSLIGIALIITLLLHTGMRLGENLNFVLISTYILSIVVGATAGIAAHIDSKSGGRMSKSLRSLTNTLHLYALWPVPALLTFHVLSVYYF